MVKQPTKELEVAKEECAVEIGAWKFTCMGLALPVLCGVAMGMYLQAAASLARDSAAVAARAVLYMVATVLC